MLTCELYYEEFPDMMSKQRITVMIQRLTGQALISACPPHSQPANALPMPMEMGPSQITAKERQRCLDQSLCLHCRVPGHYRDSCLCQQVVSFTPHSSLLFVSATLVLPNSSVSVFPLLDSGSAGIFISKTLVLRLAILVSKAIPPITIKALAGCPLSLALVMHITVPEYLSFSDHSEVIQFYVLNSNQPAMLLGLPWLRRHNSHVDW